MAKKKIFTVPDNDGTTEKYKVIYINGKRVQIEKGVEVEAEGVYSEIINECSRLHKEANRDKKIVFDDTVR